MCAVYSVPPRLTSPHQASTQEYPFIQNRNEGRLNRSIGFPASTPKISGCCNEIQVIQGTDYWVVFRRLVREAIKWCSQGKAYSNIFVLLISLISLSLSLSRLIFRVVCGMAMAGLNINKSCSLQTNETGKHADSTHQQFPDHYRRWWLRCVDEQIFLLVKSTRNISPSRTTIRSQCILYQYG